MFSQNISYIALLFLVVLMAVSCSKKNYATRAEYNFKSTDAKPHYDDLHYWAAHPWKWDVSDSVKLT